MKKYLIAFLLSLSCAFTLIGVACNKQENPNVNFGTSDSAGVSDPSDEVITDPCVVSFEEGEGFSYVCDKMEEDGTATVQKGKTISFKIELGAFYAGTPQVFVGEKSVPVNVDGVYTAKIENEESVISVQGVRKDVSQMDGTGTHESPFIVTKPVDLLYIAEQVNKKNYTYMTASYILNNNIDCKGEELQVIGNDPDNDVYFSGCFSVNYDPDTSELYDYSISNFKIETTDTNYVGLFGAVFQDLSIESSGLFYGINLENFTINASMYKSDRESKTISCGGLVGYGVGTRMLLCNATGGQINVLADKDYFAFAGGLIGYQQGYYFPEYGQSALAEIAYTTTDVEINVLDGLCLNAGGIVGYMSTNYPFGAVASVHNSYAKGSVYGALRAGGIAGGIGQYSVVSNCYATGEVVAEAIKNNNDPLWRDSEYCIAHAGGLVGFAENDSIVHDSACFGKASAYAKSGKNFAYADDFVGGGHDANQVSVQSEKYIVLDCATGADIKLSNPSAFEKELGWGDHDWVFTANEYPAINYEASSKQFSLEMSLKYVNPNAQAVEEQQVEVKGNTSDMKEYFNSAAQNPSYSSVGEFFATGSLSMYLEADNGYLSYGYFFDEACTQRVPYAYFPMKHITLYVGFADPTPVVGTYYFTADGVDEPLRLTFTKEGEFKYSEGSTENTSYYSFDGQTIYLDSTRLAMYYDGEIVIDPLNTTSYADEQFDLYRYMWYGFEGELTQEGVSLYDGVYFTKEKPFTASRTLPVLESYDNFKGDWTVSATVNKTYTFDGKGNWSYKYISYTRTFDYMNGYVSVPTVISQESGTYELINDTMANMKDGNGNELYTATFNAHSGALEIREGSSVKTYYREIGYMGAWSGSGFVLDLLGMQASGIGYATVSYDDGTYYELIYTPALTDGYVCLYIEDNGKKGDLFGYFSYDVVTNTLSLVAGSADSETGYALQSLFVVDDYNGEWISNADEFLGAEFDFNGFGLYGYTGMQGTIRITKDGKTENIEYALDSMQTGMFSYNGARYKMTYDEESKSVTLTATDKGAMELERKDIFAGMVFVTMDGEEYVFNGMSKLSIGGNITVDGADTYKYFYENDSYKIYQNSAEVGAIVRENNYYALTVNGQKEKLYQKNDLMGDWAIGGEFALFKIGPTDLDGKILATYKGYSVTLSNYTPSVLTFEYKENKHPYTYYVFLEYDNVTKENVIILSRYTNLLGEYIVCSKADEMFGTWVSNDGMNVLSFDGVRSGYKQGVAKLENTFSSTETLYYYTVKENGIIMWSQGLLQGTTWYFRIDFTENTDAFNAFVKGDKAFKQVRVDGLCLTLAKDTQSRETYEFDGGCINGGIGGIWVGNTKKYEYSYITYNGDSTATLTVKDVATGKSYYATLDYNDQANITFTLGEEIVA